MDFTMGDFCLIYVIWCSPVLHAYEFIELLEFIVFVVFVVFVVLKS